LQNSFTGISNVYQATTHSLGTITSKRFHVRYVSVDDRTTYDKFSSWLDPSWEWEILHRS